MSDAESSTVGIDDIVVSRDDEGLIVPEETYVEEFDDTVIARPMNNAAQEEYIQPFIEAVAAANAVAEEEVDVDELDDDAKDELEDLGRDALSDEKLAKLYDDHIVEPDLLSAYQANYPDEDIEELDERFVSEELKVGAKDGLFFAVLLVSDMEDLVEAFRGTVEEEESGNREEA